MASISDFLHPSRPGVVQRFVVSARETLDSFARASAAAEDFARLSDLSDKQLEARGLDRASIGRHVMIRHLDV